jgi:hypothetical protein
MQAVHPHALRDLALPGAVTVDGENVPVDDDGVFEAPGESWLAAFAERHGLDLDDVVYEEDGPPDASASALDPGDLTVADLRDAVADIDDAAALQAVRAAEAGGSDRTTALEAIDARLAELED